MSHSLSDPRSSFTAFASTVARDFSKPARRKADESTERILKAGVEELLAFGFRRTTIESVAKRAGFARMTVYRRFRSKEALAQAIFVREVVGLMRAVDREVDRHAAFETRWVEGFATTLKTLREHRLLQRLLISDPDETVASLTVRAKPVLALARGYLAAFLRANMKNCSPRDADWTAETVLRLCQSFLLTPSRCLKIDDPAELREYARKQLLPLLQACGEPLPVQARKSEVDSG